MKNGFYIHSLQGNPNDAKEWYGVGKKIQAQCEIFSRYYNIEHDIYYYDYINDTLWTKIWRRLPFTHIAVDWKYNKKYKNADFIYYRKNEVDYSVIRFFRQIRKENPKCKIILEIPTYPYDKNEFHSLSDLPFKLKDKINRYKFQRYVDRIVVFTSEKDTIWGIKTINLYNGIDFNKIKLRNKKQTDGTINIITASYFAHWHGYERLIYGMADYYSNGGERNIIFHLVGLGEAIQLYQEIIKKYKLEKYVIIHGWKGGKELDDIFENADIGIDSLGLHKMDLERSSTLKAREYCARGLPIISEIDIDFLDNNYPYMYRVPQNDEPINVQGIVNFYDSIYKNNDIMTISKLIRDNSRPKIDMQYTMKPIIDYIGL